MVYFKSKNILSFVFFTNKRNYFCKKRSTQPDHFWRQSRVILKLNNSNNYD